MVISVTQTLPASGDRQVNTPYPVISKTLVVVVVLGVRSLVCIRPLASWMATQSLSLVLHLQIVTWVERWGCCDDKRNP